MKKLKIHWIALLFFMLMTSANPTNSQKNSEAIPVVPGADTVPAVKDSTLLPVTSDRLDSLAAKAEKVGKAFDKADKKGDKMSKQLSSIQVRQLKTIHSLIYDDTKISPAMLPKPAPRIQPDPQRPEIKPVEVTRPSWWKRTFGHD